jgi:ER lumen protein retaining receptor
MTLNESLSYNIGILGINYFRFLSLFKLFLSSSPKFGSFAREITQINQNKLCKMMNLFRLAGDMSHVLSILMLLLRLRVTKNAVGISVKTQELYLIVFITRYLDLFTTFYSVYNTVMKILYISSTSYIIYMIRGTEPFKSTYDKAHDSFLHWQFAVAPCAVVALITNVVQGFDIMEVDCIFLNIFSLSLSLFFVIVILGLFNLFGSTCNCSTTYSFTKISRS